MSNWVSVKDKLPDKSGDYLVTTKNGYVQIAKWGFDLYKNSGWSGKHLAKCIIAWMPLPPSYQGEQYGKKS